MGDPDPEAMGWMRAMCGNPIAVRILMAHLPEATRSLFPPAMTDGIGRVAALFGAGAAKATV